MSMLHVRPARFLLVLFGLVLPFVAVAWSSTSTVGLLQDDAIYLSTAQALADGEGYRHVEMPARPLQTKYPPLYPAVLAVGFVLAEHPGNLPLLLLPTAFRGRGAGRPLLPLLAQGARGAAPLRRAGARRRRLLPGLCSPSRATS